MNIQYSNNTILKLITSIFFTLIRITHETKKKHVKIRNWKKLAFFIRMHFSGWKHKNIAAHPKNVCTNDVILFGLMQEKQKKCQSIFEMPADRMLLIISFVYGSRTTMSDINASIYCNNLVSWKSFYVKYVIQVNKICV